MFDCLAKLSIKIARILPILFLYYEAAGQDHRTTTVTTPSTWMTLSTTLYGEPIFWKDLALQNEHLGQTAILPVGTKINYRAKPEIESLNFKVIKSCPRELMVACRGIPDGMELAICLNKNMRNLTPYCQKAAAPCRPFHEKFCPEERLSLPLSDCLITHENELSEDCRSFKTQLNSLISQKITSQKTN